MADILNLRQARKSRLREKAAGEAAANRRKFGRTRAEKIEAAAEELRRARDIEGHRLVRTTPSDPDPNA